MSIFGVPAAEISHMRYVTLQNPLRQFCALLGPKSAGAVRKRSLLATFCFTHVMWRLRTQDLDSQRNLNLGGALINVAALLTVMGKAGSIAEDLNPFDKQNYEGTVCYQFYRTFHSFIGRVQVLCIQARFPQYGQVCQLDSTEPRVCPTDPSFLLNLYPADMPRCLNRHVVLKLGLLGLQERCTCQGGRGTKMPARSMSSKMGLACSVICDSGQPAMVPGSSTAPNETGDVHKDWPRQQA